MKKVLFIADVRNWAYDDRAKHWRSLLKKDYKIDLLYLSDYKGVSPTHKFYRLLKEYQSAAESYGSSNLSDLISEKNLFSIKGVDVRPIFNHKDYDIIYFFYHRALCDVRLMATPIPLEKVIIGINNEKWTETCAEKEYEIYMKGVAGLSVCNAFIEESFFGLNENIFRVSQCVDKRVFFKTKDKRNNKRFTVGWSGNYNNPLKNFNIIKTSCQRSRVNFAYTKDLSRDQLNLWYNTLDCVVCASKSEGGPMMILEAGAASVPVISTDVGLVREILVDKKNGLKVSPDVKSISRAIKLLSSNKSLRSDLGRNLNKEIISNWTYESKVDEIRNLLNIF